MQVDVHAGDGQAMLRATATCPGRDAVGPWPIKEPSRLRQQAALMLPIPGKPPTLLPVQTAPPTGPRFPIISTASTTLVISFLPTCGYLGFASSQSPGEEPPSAAARTNVNQG